MTYSVRPWLVHCEWEMRHSKRRIFKYLHIWDTTTIYETMEAIWQIPIKASNWMYSVSGVFLTIKFLHNFNCVLFLEINNNNNNNNNLFIFCDRTVFRLFVVTYGATHVWDGYSEKWQSPGTGCPSTFVVNLPSSLLWLWMEIILFYFTSNVTRYRSFIHKNGLQLQSDKEKWLAESFYW